ncbi:MAG: M14 family metallopeptidase [Minisyncoccia bacterium]
MKRNNIIILVVVIVLLGVGVYYFTSSSPKNSAIPENTNTATDIQKNINNPYIATSSKPINKDETIIGTSVNGLPITAYHYGTGADEILFVGGIHGGYEWNTSLVAFEAMDYLKANPNVIPSNVKVTVIPVLNPDGLNKVVGTSSRFSMSDIPTSETATIPGRFNANTVDLNRNFDCDWQTTGKWQSRTVSGGSAAFSEPESLAIKTYVDMKGPKAVVAWYSAAGGVYSSSCHNGVSTETAKLTNLFAKASGYPAYEEFDYYAITGDMVNWLAKQNVPAISVLLTNHKDTEWTKNLAGIKAVLNNYAK